MNVLNRVVGEHLDYVTENWMELHNERFVVFVTCSNEGIEIEKACTEAFLGSY